MTTQLMTQTTVEEYPEVSTNYIDAKTEATALEKMGLDLTCDNDDYRVIFTRIAYEMGDYYADNYDSMVIYETRPACVYVGQDQYNEF